MDGVILHFSPTFEKWIQSTDLKTSTPNLISHERYFSIRDWVIDERVTSTEQLVVDFFESDFSHNFIQWPDSGVAISHLVDKGWVFIAITAIGLSEKARKNRLTCLNKLYNNAFADVLVVEPSASKLEILKTFAPTFWVDDSPNHVTDGIEAGHVSFHMRREGDTRICNSPDAIIVKDWHEIVDFIESK